MNAQMFAEIKEILENCQGDIIDFRVYKGATFAYLVKLGHMYNRAVVGMDTFYGLDSPGKNDRNEHNELPYPKGYAKSQPELVHSRVRQVSPDGNYELYEGNLDTVLPSLPERKYAFALMDLRHYIPTQKAINYVYERMAPGGVIYFLEHTHKTRCLASGAINEFLASHEGEILVQPDVFFNGNRQNICRVVCGAENPPAKHEDCSSEFNTGENIEAYPITPRECPPDQDITTVALVLKTGGDTYDYRYVNALARNLREKITLPFRLAVLTDNPHGISRELVDEIIPLKHNFKGWWSKIELFRPGIFTGQVLYFDLDTVIVNNIDEFLLHRTKFDGIRDLYHHNFMQSGIMSWDAESNTHIYELFVPRSNYVMNHYAIEGDALWIRINVPEHGYLSDTFKNRIVSYKAHCLKRDINRIIIPDEASVVCFHGKPRPHTVNKKEITAHWKYQ